MKDIQAMKEKTALWQTTMNSIQANVNAVLSNLKRDTEKVELVASQQAVFAEALDKLLTQTASRGNIAVSNDDTSVLKADLQSINQEIQAIRRTMESRQGTTNTDLTNRIDSILKSVQELKGKVEESKTQQRAIEANLKKETQMISETIETSSSWGFWTYFVLFQVVFGVAVMWWKKYSDEKNKKLL